MKVLEHGVKFGKLKVDVFVYADDILPISKTRAGLCDQLDCVTEFDIKNEIKFNPSKSVFIIFNKNVKMRAVDR